MQWFTNNREVIKGLSINTGTTSDPVYTEMCTSTEVTLATDLEQQDFYTFCDAIQRSIITGAAISIETTVKIDMNNSAITGLLANALTYTKYQVPCTLNFSELGGAAEDASEFSLTIVVTGKGTVAAG